MTDAFDSICGFEAPVLPSSPNLAAKYHVLLDEERGYGSFVFETLETDVICEATSTWNTQPLSRALQYLFFTTCIAKP